MSSSSRSIGIVTINGPLGVEIRVLDGNFSLEASGTVLLEAELPPGLHMVNWLGRTKVQQRVLSLAAGDHVEISPPDIDELQASPAGTVFSERALPEAESTGLSRSRDPRVLIVLSGEANIGAIKSVNLFAPDRIVTRLRSDGKLVAQMSEEFAEESSLKGFKVRPGVHRLQYLNVAGEKLDQSVPVLSGRDTIVLMRSVRMEVLGAGPNSSPALSSGIDPARSVIVTVPHGRAVGEHEKWSTLAAELLNDLAAGTTSVGAKLIEALEARDADPLVRLYGAMVILDRLQRGRRPSLDGGRSPLTNKMRIHWYETAERLLQWPRRKGLPSDYALARQRAAIGDGSRRSKASGLTLDAPPMLDIAWAWALAASLDAPEAIPSTFSFLGAQKGAAGALPWLAWRPSSAKAGLSTGAASRSSVEKALVELASREDDMNILSERPRGATQSVAPVQDGRLVQAVKSMAQSPSAAESSGWVSRVATRVGLGARALVAAAREALEPPLSQAIDLDSVPATNRPISFPDDLHRGRFGGLSEAQGYRVTASFGPAKGDCVEVRIAVTSPTDCTGNEVYYFLHDTFEPSELIESFRGKRCTVKLKVWGGFTVGIWLPTTGIELELDLATIKGAPRIVKER